METKSIFDDIIERFSLNAEESEELVEKEEVKIKGYKAFDENLECRGFKYEVGKEYKIEGKLEICENGFHFCKTIADCYSYYPMSEKTRICEIEATGKTIEKGDKCCTSKIKIVRELPREKHRCGNVGKEDNFGFCNTGNYNYGNWNKGNYNIGERNEGDVNMGSSNKGDGNRGEWNTGNRNAGGFNKGTHNIGDSNEGERNRGFSNKGDYNVGGRNKGNQNIGYRNVGNGNFGIRNKGNYQVGLCNTNAPLVIFNKVSKMTLEDLVKSGAYEDILAGKLTDKVRAIDTFDEKVWYEIYGKKRGRKKVKKEEK